ncbi:remorin isoform X2 [Arachis ipaensis]|uniref:remorin isoform X2 n=1 Tax=Arachis ipaensis TaxID=130454 RepID=UPI0007AFA419|nr:remorin isoform X2 [Arachis ipaensis]XP_025653743.1 remorin 1.4 isoform X2 [Arachis hypogaea]QHO10996.1 Remorin [Arachis hypogaea]
MESSQLHSLDSVQVKELEKPDPPTASAVSHQSLEEPKEHAITAPLVQKVEDSGGNKDAELARVVSEKRLALIKAWEESEKTKAENRAYKKLSAVGLWESKKKASVEAQLKIIEENLERKKAEYAEKMKNKIADIHRSAEEKRAMVEAQKREEFIELEETAAKFRSSGRTPAKFFACFKA